VKSWQKILAASAVAITARQYDRSRGNLDRPLAASRRAPLPACAVVGENPHPAHRSAGACSHGGRIVLDLITT